MSSLANRVFEFAQHVIATAGGEISEALALPHQYSNPSDEAETRYIRVWDAVNAKLLPDRDSVKYYDAQIVVEFFTAPDGLSADEQVEAREISAAMAKQFAAAINDPENYTLRTDDDSICNVLIVRQDDDWRTFGEKLYPVSYLILRINPLGET